MFKETDEEPVATTDEADKLHNAIVPTHVQAKTSCLMPKQGPVLLPAKVVTAISKPVPLPLTDDELDGSEVTEQPPKKRVRVRRTKEELQSNVVRNQEQLNFNISELIATQNQIIELKKIKMQAQADQHAEAMSLQREIADELQKIYSSIN